MGYKGKHGYLSKSEKAEIILWLSQKERVHLTFADTSSRKLTIEISTAKRKDRGNTLDIPLRSR
jgi:hypothetical protein